MSSTEPAPGVLAVDVGAVTTLAAMQSAARAANMTGEVVMAKRMASLMVALLAAACSGSTGSSDPSEGGSASGGSASGGSASGGSASGGSASGGSASGGAAGKSTGGSVSNGGTGSADPRCPAKLPVGMCNAEEAGLSCQYDRFTGCSCYSPPGTYAYCQQVDPMCTLSAGAGGGGSSGAGGAAGAGSAGIGGISTKIAIAPTPQVCTCPSGTWACTF